MTSVIKQFKSPWSPPVYSYFTPMGLELQKDRADLLAKKTWFDSCKWINVYDKSVTFSPQTSFPLFLHDLKRIADDWIRTAGLCQLGATKNNI